MAERIHKLEPRRGRPGLYPWSVWTDGSAWRIRRGEDFDVAPDSMARTLHNRAARDGLSVTTKTAGEVVEFQFHNEEKAA